MFYVMGPKIDFFCRDRITTSVPCRSDCRVPERTILGMWSTLVHSYFYVSVVKTEFKQSERKSRSIIPVGRSLIFYSTCTSCRCFFHYAASFHNS